MILIIMGVAGAGKTTIGQLLARELSFGFFDADDFHNDSNIQKMRNGIPLTDADRVPWLQNIRRKIDELIQQDESAIIACSALKKSYREILHAGKDIRFIYLKGSQQLFATRMEDRPDHFMKADMLASQFEALEEPVDALIIDASLPPQQIVRRIRKKLIRK